MARPVVFLAAMAMLATTATANSVQSRKEESSLVYSNESEMSDSGFPHLLSSLLYDKYSDMVSDSSEEKFSSNVEMADDISAGLPLSIPSNFASLDAENVALRESRKSRKRASSLMAKKRSSMKMEKRGIFPVDPTMLYVAKREDEFVKSDPRVQADPILKWIGDASLKGKDAVLASVEGRNKYGGIGVFPDDPPVQTGRLRKRTGDAGHKINGAVLASVEGRGKYGGIGVFPDDPPVLTGRLRKRTGDAGHKINGAVLASVEGRGEYGGIGVFPDDPPVLNGRLVKRTGDAGREGNIAARASETRSGEMGIGIFPDDPSKLAN